MNAIIEPSLCGKYDIMFSNIVATKQFVWAPSQLMLSDEDGGDGGLSSTNYDDINLDKELVI